ncbi:MAG: hypothetical protein VX344_02645 [Bacteroidota bacterium]|nr:hypothetical protein [Bacteroidota bacterium]
MFKIFGLNRKEKIKIRELASVYSKTLFEVTEAGFEEIIDFINDNSKFEESPNIGKENILWFLLIVFVANKHLMSDYFEADQTLKLQSSCLDELIEYLAVDEAIVKEMLYEYEAFFKSLFTDDIKVEKVMAKSIFLKYKLNDFQGELLKNQNEPNPVFLQELTDLMGHFIWNWPNYMEKYKLV